MGIANLSLLTGPAITPSGGTAYPFASSGKTVANGAHVIDTAATDIRLQPSIYFNQRFPTKQKDGSWSMYKQSCLVTIPKLCADGKIQNQRIRVERETVAEATLAEKLALLSYAAQLCVDSDTTAFWASGSVA